MAKKGISFEEKRTRMLDLFHTKNTFFQLKELEKICQKETGIHPMALKEVVQSLVDDGLVDSDKIGTSIYYWSFESKVLANLKASIAQNEKILHDLRLRNAQLHERLNEHANSKCDVEEIKKKVNQCDQLVQKKAVMERELAALKDLDSGSLDKIKDEIKIITEATNKWTDNIFVLKQWMKRNLNIEEKNINAHFGIPEDFDYV